MLLLSHFYKRSHPLQQSSYIIPHDAFLISSSSELLELIHTIHFQLTISHPVLFLITAICFLAILRACSTLFFLVLWRQVFYSFPPTSAPLHVFLPISSTLHPDKRHFHILTYGEDTLAYTLVNLNLLLTRTASLWPIKHALYICFNY